MKIILHTFHDYIMDGRKRVCAYLLDQLSVCVGVHLLCCFSISQKLLRLRDACEISRDSVGLCAHKTKSSFIALCVCVLCCVLYTVYNTHVPPTVCLAFGEPHRVESRGRICLGLCAARMTQLIYLCLVSDGAFRARTLRGQACCMPNIMKSENARALATPTLLLARPIK